MSCATMAGNSDRHGTNCLAKQRPPCYKQEVRVLYRKDDSMCVVRITSKCRSAQLLHLTTGMYVCTFSQHYRVHMDINNSTNNSGIKRAHPVIPHDPINVLTFLVAISFHNQCYKQGCRSFRPRLGSGGLSQAFRHQFVAPTAC